MHFKPLATATIVVGFAAFGPMVACYAQSATPPFSSPSSDSRGLGPHRPDTIGPRGMGRPDGMDAMRRHPIDPSMFGLIYRPDDRKLTAPDVQKIAESLLLWFGNRTWKVTGVEPAGDGQIAFAFATAEGSVVARFAMNPKNGRVVRTG